LVALATPELADLADELAMLRLDHAPQFRDRRRRRRPARARAALPGPSWSAGPDRPRTAVNGSRASAQLDVRK